MSYTSRLPSRRGKKIKTKGEREDRAISIEASSKCNSATAQTITNVTMSRPTHQHKNDRGNCVSIEPLTICELDNPTGIPRLGIKFDLSEGNLENSMEELKATAGSFKNPREKLGSEYEARFVSIHPQFKPATPQSSMSD